MIRAGERVFVDTGAWIALAEERDPFHDRARVQWESLVRGGARPCTSVAVVIETFTFLDRRGTRELALRWRASIKKVERFEIFGCSAQDLAESWTFFERRELYKLSLVDATSFLLMRKHHVRAAFTFDSHFALAGFQGVG